ncbi:MAG: serine protease [Chthoniobacteraceae bacterium]
MFAARFAPVLLATLGGMTTTVPARGEDQDRIVPSKYMVIVEGDHGAGSASIIQFRGNPLITTNAHVLSGNQRVKFRLLNNTELTPGTFGIAQDSDVAVFTQDAVKEGLKILADAEKNMAVGDAVVVFGNSLGGQVVTEIRGKIVGIGPELVEVNAPFVEGNSGSPIIHVKTGKVIGLATFATFEEVENPLVAGSRFAQVRRFGVRLDTITKWEYPTWQKFAREARQMETTVRGMATLILMARDLADDGSLNPAVYEQADARVQRRVKDCVKELSRRGMAKSYYTGKKSEFLRWMINETITPGKSLQPSQFTRFHARNLEQMLDFRKRLQFEVELMRSNQSGSPRFDLLPPTMRDRNER